MTLFDANIITLQPELFPGPLQSSLIGKALKNNIWSLSIYSLRDFGKNKCKMVDDKPFGGGTGMVILAEVLGNAIEHIKSTKIIDKIIYFSPRGRIINQAIINNLSEAKNYIFICGKFEAIDERVIEEYNILEYSLGDFILSAGDIACIAMIDSYVRTLPYVLGNKETLIEESFGISSEYEYLLEYPQYTRPSVWRNKEVPSILLTGNHKKIREWRLAKAKADTASRRPDLINKIKN